MQDIASNTAQDILRLEVIHIMLCYNATILVQMGCIKCILNFAGPRCGANWKLCRRTNKCLLHIQWQISRLVITFAKLHCSHKLSLRNSTFTLKLESEDNLHCFECRKWQNIFTNAQVFQSHPSIKRTELCTLRSQRPRTDFSVWNHDQPSPPLNTIPSSTPKIIAKVFILKNCLQILT